MADIGRECFPLVVLRWEALAVLRAFISEEELPVDIVVVSFSGRACNGREVNERLVMLPGAQIDATQRARNRH